MALELAQSGLWPDSGPDANLADFGLGPSGVEFGPPDLPLPDPPPPGHGGLWDFGQCHFWPMPFFANPMWANPFRFVVDFRV